MKRWIALALILMLTQPFAALAQTMDETQWAYVSEDGEIMLKYYSGGRGYLSLYDGDDVLHIPSTIEGVPVTSMSDYLLDFLTGKVEFDVDPDSSTFMKSGPFLMSKDAKTLIAVDRTAKGILTIPGGVTTIGPNAMRNCSELTQITIPDSVTRIGNWAFEGCAGLTEFEIPETIEHLGFGAFSKCENLRFVSVPSTITEIGERTFADCAALEDVVLHEGLEVIGLRAFSECAKLSVIQLPRGLKTIDEEAFYGCTALSSLIMPGSLSRIGEYAFYQCHNLQEVAMPGDVSNIADTAFENCSGALTLLVPDGSKAAAWALGVGVKTRVLSESDMAAINEEE